MATVRIPTSSELPSYSQRTTLDGREYVLEFDWSERAGAWYLRLLDVDRIALTGRKRVVLNTDLLRLHRRTEGVPPGRLVALDLSGSGLPPAFDELGSRVVLLYTEAE